MRLAIFSDVHGNLLALHAVLTDIQARGGVDGYRVLGDLAALGYDPIMVLRRLVTLPNIHFVRGNTDRYLVTGERPPPSADDVRNNPDLAETYAEVAANFAWTHGCLTPTLWLDWLAGLPLEHRETLPDGTRMLCVHAAPGRDDGDGIAPATSDAVLARLVAGCEADLVCVGHTHWPLERRVNAVHVVNVGSISNPHHRDLRASYVIITADETSYRIEFHRVAYNTQAVIDAIREIGYPSADYLISFFAGQRSTILDEE